jgi:Zn-finger nucleic acid-binding protein
MACSSCLGLMFVGSQFCGHCGAKVVPAEIQAGERMGDCPRCRKPLEMLKVGPTTLRECQKCGGMWSDVSTFEQLCSTREKQAAVLGYIGERVRNAEPLAKISYVPCPDCKQLMNRSNFGRASGIIIDICKKHGVWFDTEELPKIIEFLQKGGMELARQRDKMEVEAQRNQLREEQRKLGFQNQTFDMNDELGSDNSPSISWLLARLFE